MSIYRYKHELKFKNYIRDIYNFHIDPAKESHFLFQKKLQDIVIGKSRRGCAAISCKAKEFSKIISSPALTALTYPAVESKIRFSSLKADLKLTQEKRIGVNFLKEGVFPHYKLSGKKIKIISSFPKKYMYIKKRHQRVIWSGEASAFQTRSLKEIQKISNRFNRLICKPTFRVTRQMVEKTITIAASRLRADEKNGKKVARGNRTLSITYQMIGRKLGEFVIETPKPKKEKKKKK